MGCASSTVPSTPRPQPVVESISQHEFLREYALGQMLGKGSFAQVHVAQRRSSKSRVVAVKIQSLRRKSSSKVRSRQQPVCNALKEVGLWSRIGDHRNCVKLIEPFFYNDLCYMVMEKCSHDLISHIKTFPTVTEASLVDVFTQMLQGIAHLHSIRIVHRDIKPENFLVGGKHAQTVKLCDFGLAAFVPDGGKAQGVCGTAPYMCPEMLVHGEADCKADVWSLGVIAHLLFCGAWPYNGPDGRAMKMAIASGYQETFTKLSWLTLSAKLFLGCLLTRQPSDRPRARAALKSAFLTSSFQSPSSLDTIFAKAEQVIDTHTPNHQELSVGDLARESTKAKSKALTLSHIDAYLMASQRGLDKVVEDLWPPDSSDSDCEKKSVSIKSKSTTFPSSSFKSSFSDMGKAWGFEGGIL